MSTVFEIDVNSYVTPMKSQPKNGDRKSGKNAENQNFSIDILNFSSLSVTNTTE